MLARRIIGYQPHPERSGGDGLQLLRNMLVLTGLVPASPAGADQVVPMAVGGA